MANPSIQRGDNITVDAVGREEPRGADEGQREMNQFLAQFDDAFNYFQIAT